MKNQVKSNETPSMRYTSGLLFPDATLAQYCPGDSLIILTAAEMTAAFILDALRDLDRARSAYMMRLREACGCCDTLCRAGSLQLPAKATLQQIPENLLSDLRGQGICIIQLARHLAINDIIYKA